MEVDMALRHSIGDVHVVAEGIWRARLTPAEIRRLGDGRNGRGKKSIVGVWCAGFDVNAGMLALDPDAVVVMNIGTSDEVIFLDLGDIDVASLPTIHSTHLPGDDAQIPIPTGRGDKAFIADCKQHLDDRLVSMAQRIISEIRAHYPGELHEGLARKWVNHP